MLASQLSPTMWIAEYIGKEFTPVGREDKFDCWGLVRHIYKNQLDISLPRHDEYESVEDLERLDVIINSGKIRDEWYEIPRGTERIYDVVLFKIQNQLCHVGFCLGNNVMLHIQKGKDSCIENYTTVRWERRVHSFYRHENLLGRFAE